LYIARIGGALSFSSVRVDSVKILSSAHPWLDRQRSSSVLFGGLVPLVSIAAERGLTQSVGSRFCSAVLYRSSLFGSLAYVSCSSAISCRCSLFGSLAYVSVRRRSRVARGVLGYALLGLPLFTVLRGSRLLPPGGLM
jgi:hypothetical protein